MTTSPKAVAFPGLATAAFLLAAACGRSSSSAGAGTPAPKLDMSTTAPSPDPRIGLEPGLRNAGQATWNLRLLSATPPSSEFEGKVNSDMTFTGKYVIQGSYDGFQVWDISDPAHPALTTAFVCPASQSDVSVYRNLLFVSGEDLNGRLDCGTQGVPDTVSKDRLRGIRIFDISDIRHPRNITNVQTCRGSHTHSLLVDPEDTANVYIYVSGSAQVRSPSELAGCVSAPPAQDSSSALFRIEVIKVPLAHPEQAAIVSSPRIFSGLTAPPRHGETREDLAAEQAQVDSAKSKGAFTIMVDGREKILPPDLTQQLLEGVVRSRGGTGAAAAADSATLRDALKGVTATEKGDQAEAGPTQCHDITVYAAIGLGGGACEGYGLLLDIRDPEHPARIAAASDSNFSYWHSATFNNDGTKLLFSDEWGGGGQPKCRTTDPKEWGADAIFTIADGKLQFQSYYKMPAPQTTLEVCVAHNGSLIPIPGRDVMVQSWYEGGLSVFDWTDAAHPKEIGFFDRGPSDSTKLGFAGSWSAYWYNGVIVSSEIARGLDVLELMPSGLLTRNEIEAAKSVHLDYLNVQGQRKFVWPPTFALARAYLDQLERSKGLDGGRIASARSSLASAEKASGATRQSALATLATELDGEAGSAGDPAKLRALAGTVRDLAAKS